MHECKFHCKRLHWFSMTRRLFLFLSVHPSVPSGKSWVPFFRMKRVYRNTKWPWHTFGAFKINLALRWLFYFYYGLRLTYTVFITYGHTTLKNCNILQKENDLGGSIFEVKLLTTFRHSPHKKLFQEWIILTMNWMLFQINLNQFTWLSTAWEYFQNTWSLI